MPLLPRGPVIYQCDREGCGVTIQGIAYSWWKIEDRWDTARSWLYYCSLDCLMRALAARREVVIVRPPTRRIEEIGTYQGLGLPDLARPPDFYVERVFGEVRHMLTGDYHCVECASRREVGRRAEEETL